MTDNKYITNYETDTARIKVRFSDRTDITREEVFDGIARAMYNLALYEHERELKLNEDNTKLT